MATTLFYFTGTGNSLWAARALARELGDTGVISMAEFQTHRQMGDSAAIGLVFPVHIWGVPKRVLDFLDELQAMSPEYIFAVATNGGQVANTLVQLKKAMAAGRLTLDSAWSLQLPSNYIPWGGPGSPEKQRRLFEAAGVKVAAIADQVRRRLRQPVEKGPLWQHLIFTPIYKMTYSQVPKMDKDFWVDGRCDRCSLCVKVCPAQNLLLQDGRLVWQHRCEQCLACLQWCPKEALQFGKKTPAYERYHHPEVKFKDVMGADRRNG